MWTLVAIRANWFLSISDIVSADVTFDAEMPKIRR